MTELGLSMAGRTQRDDVVQRVCVVFYQKGRLKERPNWDDMMDVRVPAEFLGVDSAENARPTVALERPFTDAVPSRTVRSVPASFPIRMAATRERIREPGCPTFVTAKRHLAGDVARVSLKRFVTHGAG